MKKKICIAIVIVGLILILFGCLLSINIIKKYSIGKFIIDETKTKTIYNCDTSNCITKQYDLYEILSYNKKREKITNIINEINKNTESYYNLVNNSSDPDDECAKYKVNKSIRVNTDYDLYENKEYISITINRKKEDICDRKIENVEMKTYIYDKEKEKIITQEEFKKQEGITENIIKNSIINSIKEYNDGNEYKMKYEDMIDNKGKNKVTIYYSSTGSLFILYYNYTDSKYYIGEIKK